jgi:hypothetical protein
VKKLDLAGALWKKLVRWLSPLFQAPATASERHQEINQKVPEWPGSWGPPWYLLVYLLVSPGVSVRE